MARILIAGSGETAAQARAALADTGHALIEGPGPADTLVQLARVRKAELVLLELEPEGAVELADRLHRDDLAILLTAESSDAAAVARARRVHPAGFLLRPLDAAELRVAVEIALVNHEIHARMRASHRQREEELQRRIEKLRTLSLVDELTGILNRRGFVIHAEQAVRLANRNREALSVLFIDVDGLKQTNDGLGHAAGDGLIRDCASVLRVTLRDSDIVGRVGGDEFAVVAIGCTPQRLPELLVRLQAQVDKHNASAGHRPPVSFSVGTVLHDPAHPEPIEVLLARADAEMYARKRAKRQVR